VNSQPDGGTDSLPIQFTESQLRRWLTLLQKPDQLACPEVEALLDAHGRRPDMPSEVAVGKAAAELLIEEIERLAPKQDSSRDQNLPHLVLRTCFIDGAKLFQAAARLGLSERQLTRERTRAIRLLKSELEVPIRRGSYAPYRPEPIPRMQGFFQRPAATRALAEALAKHHLVHVHGPVGIGKTSLVAELAAQASIATPVLWYRFRAGVNTSLVALLFELGEYLRHEGLSELSGFMTDALPDPDTSLATRIALQGFSGRDQLLVFDDYQTVETDLTIIGWIDEVVSRLPGLRIVTISRHRYGGNRSGMAFEVGSLTRVETKDFLAHLGVDLQPDLNRRLHLFTHGNPHLVKLAASWLKKADEDEVAQNIRSFGKQAKVQEFLLESVTELMDPDDRAVLEAATVFRERFSDDALAFVSGHTLGAIQDASLRLMRVYLATRSRDGESAFVHASVRDYVYARLASERRAHLHERAAEWYEKVGKTKEAHFQRERSAKS
jgi:ATP/maltotriose-dependent transcriptional regulator MalT